MKTPAKLPSKPQEHKETPAFEAKMHDKKYLVAALRKKDPQACK